MNRPAVRRLPAGLKLIALSLACLAIVWIHSLLWLGIAALGTLLVTLLARPARRALWQQLRPVLLLTALALLFNIWFLPLEQALLISGRVLLVLTLAALFTLTTPVAAVLDAIDRALTPIIGRRRSERFGLMVALTIRSIPLLTELVTEVQQARKARGLERSLRAFAVPVVVRALKSADELGDALTARGVVD